MNKKFLVADDSALMRRVICDIIQSIDGYTVECECKNGEEAYQKIKEGNFDVVILDIMMPRLTGLEVLERLQKENIKVTAIMCSTLTSSGSPEAKKALELDAANFIEKPSNFIEAKGDDFKNSLLTLVEGLTGGDEARENIRQQAAVKAEPIKKAPPKPKAGIHKKLVALACSTGGPKSLARVIPKIAGKLDAPMLIVQHMPAGFTNSLAEKLDAASELHVKEAEDGEKIKKGTAYIAPGGMHITLEKDGNDHRIRFLDIPPIGGLKPCADVMYRSLRDTGFDEITCVVLTGMGADGTAGITQLNESEQIHVISQSAETCVVYGMPKAIFLSGLVDEVVDLEDIGEAITKNVGVM